MPLSALDRILKGRRSAPGGPEPLDRPGFRADRDEPGAWRTRRLCDTSRNLIDNALRHTPPGGRVDLSLLRQNDAVILEVADTGPGIPASEIDRISNRSFVEVAREVMEPASAFRLCVV
ncbi:MULTISPECIES: sensor histidine kinase [Bradyrhizobium]|uniref:ATP-binding protein n=1 Tax=unclassified Bradyrhizobium TaxID=2631580 RepID=UPI001E57FCE6|nr:MULTISPECIES: sensor histidine kinase [Bradyrhizobium]